MKNSEWTSTEKISFKSVKISFFNFLIFIFLSLVFFLEANIEAFNKVYVHWII